MTLPLEPKMLPKPMPVELSRPQRSPGALPGRHAAPAIEGDTQAFIDRITKLPLAHQPATEFEYGFSIDVLGAVIEKVSEQRLGDYLAANVWKPLGMKDATFHPAEGQRDRLARPFPNDPLTGKPQSIKLLDTPTKSDCGGACSFATVGDYIRFGQMLLNGGELDGQRILGPKTVHHMTTNHLGPEIKNNVANVEPHRGGFGFGLAVAVRTSEGLSSVPGNPGEPKYAMGWMIADDQPWAGGPALTRRAVTARSAVGGSRGGGA